MFFMKEDGLKEKILRWFSEWAKLKPNLHLVGEMEAKDFSEIVDRLKGMI